MTASRPGRSRKSSGGGSFPQNPEGHYQLLFESNPHPMWVYDLETLAFLAVNDTAIRRYGYSREEFLAMTIKDIRLPEDVPALLANIAQVTEGLDEAGVWRHRKKDGTIVDVDIVSHTLIFAGRRAELVLAQDVTARRKAARALQESEERYRMLFDLDSDALFVIENETGRLLETNSAAVAMYGYGREELLGMRNSDLSAEPQETRRVSTETPLAPERTVRVPLRFHRRKDGTVFPVEITGRFFEWQGRGVHIAAIRDIAERRRADEAVLESEHKFATLFRSSPDMVGIVTLEEGRYLDINDGFTRSLGYTRDEGIGRTIAELGICADPVPRTTLVKALARDGAVRNWEIAYRTKSGGTFIGLVSAEVIELSGSRCVLAVTRDISDRKRAEVRLRDSEQRFRTLAEASFEGIALTEHGVLVDLNHQLARMLGGTREDFIGHPVMDSVAPESRALVEAALAEERMEPYEHVALRRDGSVFSVEIRARSMEAGERRLRVTAIRDITDRKRTEAALRESEERLDFMMSNSPAVVYTCKPFGDFGATFITHNVVHQLGYESQEFLGDPGFWAAHLHPEDAPRVFAGMDAVFADGSQTLEYRFRHKDGNWRWMHDEMKLIRGAAGDPVEIIGFWVDITNRKSTEEALLRSETRYRHFSELTSDYVYSCTRSADGPYRIEWVGGAFERISGYTAEDLLGLGCWLDLVHAEDRARVESHLLGLAPGQTGAIDFRLVGADGSIRWIRETSRCVPHEDRPDRLRLYGTSQDITERRRVEEEQRRLEEHIRHVQKLESLGVLAGGIAHDFNNLLMAILGNADLALLALSPASPARQNIEEIGTASRRAAELCRQMLAYSGKGRFVVEKLDLSELVREMANILEVSVSKKATLRCHYPEGLPAVEADATQVRQVVMNLITNASEALGERPGVISISTGAMACDRAYLLDSVSGTDLPAGRYVFLEVSDSGCGMDAETQRRIFDPFFTTKFTGRGLGLAAVLGIVRGHGGSIRVRSQPGKGTTFTVLLPALDTPARPTEKPMAAPQPWHGDGTVLLVDDEPGVRRVGEEMLEVLGFRVLTAADGVEAVHVFRQHADAIACVILDLTMPRMNGEEAFRELRRIRGDVRVVLSSGYDEQDVTRRFFGEGPTGFVQKPYTVDLLREVVQRALA